MQLNPVLDDNEHFTLEDAQDLLDLNEAIEEHKGAVGVPLDDILKKYNVNQQP